ncbi:hypothetical protein [Solibacillus sp. CAU 1738]|uniref:hypothetical protein n=1 Tax=Solibacillus sp. CAU 1738 TaxID=3140363 RepID=UPI00325FFC32
MKRFLVICIIGIVILTAGCKGTQENTESNKLEVGAKEVVGQLVVTGDIVSEQLGCVLASQFAPGDLIVFRNNVVDGLTNEQVKDAVLQVHLSTGEVIDMKYGPHGEDNFWVAVYPVTEDTPTGQLGYTVKATLNDRVGEFKPFNVAPSLLTIIAGNKVSAAGPSQSEEDLSNIETNQKVDIIGVNFEFKGPNGEKTFYVKANEEVTLTLKSEEGMHGVAIEGMDVSLQQDGELKFMLTEPGEYRVFCNVFCGPGHSDMVVTLVVV